MRASTYLRFAAFVVLLLFCGQAHADRRVALVIGNSAYQNVARLDNPKNDALLMAKTLQGLGFTLVGNGAALDLDKQGLDTAVRRFGREVEGADVALFYYAGHGVQINGSNYLVPVNANPTKEADVDFEMVDINLVLHQLQDTSKRLNLVILDACRNNPFGGRGLGRATDGGLAQMRAPAGTLISYATQPGAIAQDGDDGDSPYTKALARTMSRAGLDIFQTFNQVGLDVQKSTGGAQQPWTSASPIDGNFYFGGEPVRADNSSGDEAAWSFVKDAKEADEVRRFIAQFPNSARRAQATEKLTELELSARARDQNVASVPATPDTNQTASKASTEDHNPGLNAPAPSPAVAPPVVEPTQDQALVAPSVALVSPPATDTWPHIDQSAHAQALVPYKKGLAELTNQHFEAALSDFEEAIQHDPDFAEAYVYHAQAIDGNRQVHGQVADKRQHARALDDFAQAIRIHPDSASNYAGRGWEYSFFGEYKMALVDYDRAIQLNSGDASYFRLRAESRYRSGDKKGARADFAEAKRLDPNHSLDDNYQALCGRRSGC
jgi:tetratricopeptide (TPR) repeat protein